MTCVKVPSRSQEVAALQESSRNPLHLPGVAAGMADVQPAAGISFSKMATNQASCTITLRPAVLACCRQLSPPP
jgi:hypothetical protein